MHLPPRRDNQATDGALDASSAVGRDDDLTRRLTTFLCVDAFRLEKGPSRSGGHDLEESMDFGQVEREVSKSSGWAGQSRASPSCEHDGADSASDSERTLS